MIEQVINWEVRLFCFLMTQEGFALLLVAILIGNVVLVAHWHH